MSGVAGAALQWPQATQWFAALTLAVGGISLVVLVGGWLAGTEVLIRLHTSYAAMVPSTAVSFLLLSVGLLGWRLRGGPEGGRGLPRWLGAAVIVVAVVDVVVILSGTATGVDALLWPGQEVFQTDGMALATAGNMMLGAGCLLCLAAPSPRSDAVFQTFATLGLLSALVAVVGYAFDADALYDIFVFSAMALHTAVTFAMLFTALLLARPTEGWVGVLAGPGAGSAAARQLFPVVVLAPIVFCYLTLMATRAGLLNEHFRLSLLAIVMSALAAVALLRNAAIVNRERRRLQGALSDLETASRDKDLLLREVYHRVKNNLQQIDALIALEKSKLEQPKARLALDSLSGRVQALGLVHQLLIAAQLPSQVRVGDFLRQLCTNIADSHGLAQRRIELRVDAGNDLAHIDVAMSLGLLVNELVTNAVKHAFQSRGAGTIRVAYGRADDGSILLSVSDDGVGMAGGKALPLPRGSGSTIISSLVAQLRAEMKIETAGGTTVTLVIPEDINERHYHE